MPAPINIIGQRFGRLVVLEYRGSDRGNTPFWLCQCDCGEQTVTEAIRFGAAERNRADAGTARRSDIARGRKDTTPHARILAG